MGDGGISTELRQLLSHMEWADALVWQAVMPLEGAREDPRIRELLHHVHTVQWVYLQLWLGEDLAVRGPDDFPDLPSLCRWARAYHDDLAAFLSSLDASVLDRPVRFPWAEALVERFGEVATTDVRQAILQVTSHSTYHRGQVNARIRELGGEPPLTDFVAWVWAGQPSPGWPEDGEGGGSG
jgi:uncharacterized damage-inducible protein DinB